MPLTRRDLALEMGAVAVTWRQCGAMRRRRVIEGVCGLPHVAIDWYAEWRRDQRPKRTPV